MRKNVAGQAIGCQMVSATDGSAFTGTVTVYVAGDAGTQAIGSVGSGVCTHEGNGYHTYSPTQAETNYDLCAFTFIGSGAVPSTVQIYTRHDANVTAFGGTAGAFSSGRPEVNATHVAGTSQTARDLGGQLDATVSSRLASASYTAPDNAGISSAASSASSAASSASTAATNTTTILSRLGSFAASGVNTVLGFFLALMKKDASTPSDIGGTYNPATDSLEAQQDNGGTLTTAGANAVADALLDRTDGTETGETPRQSLRLIRAAAVGKCDGAAGTTMHFRDKADSKNRITATVDSDGNRTAVTTDAT